MALLWGILFLLCSTPALGQFGECDYASINQIPDFEWDDLTALDDYVHNDDGFYTWTDLAQYDYDGATLYIVNMTSQKWMDEDYVENPVWWHYMGIAIPDEVRDTSAGVLGVGAGNMNDDVPDTGSVYSNMSVNFAIDSGTVTGFIMQVPNQPSYFMNDYRESRSEDRLIAWTWRTAIDDPTNNPEQVARLPFTKAAKRGLDTIAELAFRERGYDISRFLVMGASKRGWTSWSLAATDQRVIAAAPLVFSLLNAREALQAHFRSLGGAWSFAFRPYFDEDLTYHLMDPELDWMFDLEDMIRYRSRLTMPKLLIVATGDEFFLTHDSHNWFEHMTEPMYMMMNPNAEHVLFPHWVRIYETIMSFWINVLEGYPMPEMSWTRNDHGQRGEVILHTDQVENIVGVRALRSETLQNDTIRDWRLAAGDPPSFHPVFWFNDTENMENPEAGEYTHEVEDLGETNRWVGHFIEVQYQGPEGHRMFLTTEVNMVPDEMPENVDCCEGVDCYGYLT